MLLKIYIRDQVRMIFFSFYFFRSLNAQKKFPTVEGLTRYFDNVYFI
jgi:hypothetical protein